MNWLLLKNHPKQNMICCFFIKITKFKMRLTRFFGLRATYDILARRLHFVAITLNFDVKTIYLWRNRETATHNIINLKILCHVLISFSRTNQNWLLRLNIKKKDKKIFSWLRALRTMMLVFRTVVKNYICTCKIIFFSSPSPPCHTLMCRSRKIDTLWHNKKIFFVCYHIILKKRSETSFKLYVHSHLQIEKHVLTNHVDKMLEL